MYKYAVTVASIQATYVSVAWSIPGILSGEDITPAPVAVGIDSMILPLSKQYQNTSLREMCCGLAAPEDASSGQHKNNLKLLLISLIS